ncbi:MAG: SDR family NAD(P)-dependent oxidoreductase [Cytophagales bacterium]|nr:SDR family NAD(P)-dependent oxidoreductase [Cytophagales bacterium]
MSDQTKTQKEPIAIVGIGCRLPGNIKGPQSYWEALKNGVDGIREVPADRWSVEDYYDPNPNKAGKMKTKKGGFLDSIDQFDAEFFKLFPKEAERMDPQQRMLLESAFEALEDGGMKLEEFKKTRTSVFMGVFMNDYWDIQASSLQRERISPHVPMGVSLTSIANRISYLYDLKGPSITLDTACSSSLVGVHLACQTIWNGEADQALAGGVNVILRPESSIMMSKGNFLCPDGYCKSFDARANGYTRGEGAGVIILKPLSKALEDGNDIYSVIKGSAVNSDGYTEAGFTVPSAEAQTTMLKAAYKDAGIDPLDVQYIEAHGTGTPVGDPIESRTFFNVFGQNRPENDPLIIGSVKSNIGHLEAAAGIAGLIKVALCVKNRQIPKNLHFETPNPKIPFGEYRLKVSSELQDWPKNDRPLIGGVNSFGAGGTNAHVVLEEYAAEKADKQDVSAMTDVHLFTLSARSEQALKQQVENYLGYLEKNDCSLNALCKSLGTDRSMLEHRLAAGAYTKEELTESLEAFLEGENRVGMSYTVVEEQEKKKIGFIYSGQGPQWFAMGRQLIESDPEFRAIIHEIEGYFSEIASWSLLEEMSKDEESSKISDTRIAQPAIMAIQIALTELWKRYGVEPEGVVGHSIGEVAAAYTSGALTLRQAVEVIYHRSRGQNRASGKGKMLAVAKPLDYCLKLIEPTNGRVNIGAINGPEMIALSGDSEPLEKIAEKLDKEDIFHRFLRVTVPFHSHHMDSLKDELISSLKELQPAKAKLPLYSTVTGKKEDGLHLVSDYWYANVRQPVYFTDAVETMIEDGFNTFIEIAPHPVLAAGAMDMLKRANKTGDLLPSIRRKEEEKIVFIQSLGKLHTLGVKLNWDKIYPEVQEKAELLPYPWQHQSYWFETFEHRKQRLEARVHPYLINGVRSNFDANQIAWDVDLDKDVHPFVEDHKVDDVIIFPGTGHLEIATAAAQATYGEDFGFIEDVSFQSALFLPDEGEPPYVRLEVSNNEGRYWISTKPKDDESAAWTRHSTGKINHMGDSFVCDPLNLEEIKQRVSFRQPIQPMYKELKQGGLLYGDTFRAITGLWLSPGEVLSKVSLHESLEYGIERYNIHPAIMDACLHTIFAAKRSTEEERRGIYLPVGVKRFKFFKKPESKDVWSYVKVHEVSEKYLSGDFQIFDDNGDLIAAIQGLDCKYIEGSRGEGPADTYKGAYEYQWSPVVEAFEESGKKGPAVIFADALGLSGRFEKALTARGFDVYKIFTGDAFEKADDKVYRVNPMEQMQIEQTLKEIGTINHVVYLWGTDMKMSGETTAEQLDGAQGAFAMRTVHTLRAVLSTEQAPAVWLAATGAEAVDINDSQIELAQAAIYGIGRVMINEYSHLPMRIVDCSDETTDEEINNFAGLLCSENRKVRETEFALRGENIYLRRLEAVNPEEAETSFGTVKLPASGADYRAEVQEIGLLDTVAFRRYEPSILKGDEVRIDVKASGLNFKDIMNGMGLLEDEAVAGGVAGKTLGLECAGVVSAVGPEVKDLKIGDEILSWSAYSLAGTTTAAESCTVKKPSNIDFAQAATIPVVFLTAYYSLNYLGRMEAGDRVLIHSATGGLGIAAIQLAKLSGAEIFATAGTEEKREYLRSMGIKYVYDSRSLSFRDEIMRDTQNEGLDIVLNSLTGKALIQSLKCLRPFGRFVEVGKADIYNDSSLSLKRFGENLSFHGVDVDRLMAQRPALGKRLFEELIALFAEGKLQPHPNTRFAMAELGQALTYLSKTQHIGKVVVEMGEEDLDILPSSQLSFRDDAAYIVTGGASGLGLELASWMAEAGAKYLALVSRSGAKTDYDREVIENMEKAGVKILMPKADITDYAAVTRVFEEIKQANWPAVHGIMHSAGLLSDATFPNMDLERYRKVFNPKVLGAWNFHKASEGQPLDFFLSTSSISSVFGLPGQSNYSSANNFLDKLAIYRQLQGKAGNSVNFGVLGNFAGMSREGGNVLNVLSNQGWIPLTLKQIKEKVGKVILQRRAVRMVANIDWKNFREFFIHLSSDARYAHLMTDEALNMGGANSAGGTLKDQVLAAAEEERHNMLTEKLTEALAKILGTSPEKVDASVSMTKIGLDSLMQNQLRNWVHQKLEVNYPLMKIAKGPSLIDLATDLLGEMAAENAPQEDGEERPLVVGTSADVLGLTDSEDVEVLNDYLVHVKSEKTETAKLRVFCCHPVGAGASMFSHFMYHAPEDVDLFAFQLPGRENRLNEAAHTDIFELIDEMIEAALPYMDRPFALWGHSFGGVVMFELARKLRERNEQLPAHFFASATIAPQLTGGWKNSKIISQTAMRENSEARLLSLMSYIDDVEFVKQILPIMRNDMPLIMSYPYADQEKLECPITVFSAQEDEVVMPSEMAPWQEQTSGTFRQEIVHGDHWFLSRNKEFVLEVLEEDLQNALQETELA